MAKSNKKKDGFMIIYPRKREDVEAECNKRFGHKWLFTSLDEDAGKMMLEHIKEWSKYDNKVMILDDETTNAYFKLLQDLAFRLIHCTWQDSEPVRFEVITYDYEDKDFDFYLFSAGMDENEINKNWNIFVERVKRWNNGKPESDDN